jgi:hypothetical protein
MSTTAEDLIDALLTRPSEHEVPELSDLQLDRLTDDVARKIHPPETIAARYGLTNGQLLTLLAVPHIRRMARTKRSIWESDQSALERVRQYWAIGMENSAPSLINMMHDPTVTPSNRIEIAKMGSKLAGLDATKEGGPAPGTQFAVNIHFSGGGVERISTPVLEGAAE